MKKTLWRNVLFAFAMLVFACLLVSGGSRLIASPEKQPGPIQPQDSWLSASLSCPPSVRVNELQEGKHQDNRQTASEKVCVEAREAQLHIPQTDANGNVLCQTSYMRSVYQAFALGDGFA